MNHYFEYTRNNVQNVYEHGSSWDTKRVLNPSVTSLNSVPPTVLYIVKSRYKIVNSRW